MLGRNSRDRLHLSQHRDTATIIANAHVLICLTTDHFGQDNHNSINNQVSGFIGAVY